MKIINKIRGYSFDVVMLDDIGFFEEYPEGCVIIERETDPNPMWCFGVLNVNICTMECDFVDACLSCHGDAVQGTIAITEEQ